MEYENKEICESCGGMCCKKSGCDYFVDNFSVINKETIIEILQKGNTSIVSTLKFEYVNDKLICVPFLYLRARNIDRDVIDLLSLKKQCSLLRSDGCPYTIDERPRGGVNLIPSKNGCETYLDPMIEINKWEPYQNLLAKLVKRFTGMSVDERLRKDVEILFKDILEENFDGVSKTEIIDVLQCLPHLVECYSEEYKRVKKDKSFIKSFKINKN